MKFQKAPKRGSTSKSTIKKPKAPFAGLHHFSFLFKNTGAPPSFLHHRHPGPETAVDPHDSDGEPFPGNNGRTRGPGSLTRTRPAKPVSAHHCRLFARPPPSVVGNYKILHRETNSGGKQGPVCKSTNSAGVCTPEQIAKSFSSFLAAPTPLARMELAGAAASPRPPESHVQLPRPPPQPPEKVSSFNSSSPFFISHQFISCSVVSPPFRDLIR
jgi:hypothetical protein